MSEERKPTEDTGAQAVAYWQAQAATAIRAAEASAAEVDRLGGQLAQTQAERDTALAQLASVRAQLARVSSTLADERRRAAVQRR